MKNRAFSLAELLVVVAIIATLAAIILPVFRIVKLRGYAVQSGHNLQQLVIANLNYATDHGCYAPADDRWNNRRWHGARSSAGGKFDPTKGFLADYLGASQRVGICPLFQDMVQGAGSFEDGSGGYGYNAAYIGGTPVGDFGADGNRISARPVQVTRPSATLMFASSAYAVPGGVQEYPFADPPFWDFGDGPSGIRPSPTVHFRFQGRALVAWCDGHQTMEALQARAAGENPHGGLADEENLGWFGPDENNGFWNTASVLP